jgi:protein required for attachment to host cells
VSGKTWTAPEAELPRDNAGVGYSIAGPGRAAVEQTDPQEVIDENFAKTVIEDLSKAHYQKQFDRLILIAGPHMLGLLRAQIDTGFQRVLAGELSKDLLNQPDDVVESHIGELIAV